MPVLPAPRGVAGGQCQEMWQEEERSNNKGCRSPPICSVLMSEPRSSWTRRDPQCVTAMYLCISVCIYACVYMTICHKLDPIHNGLVEWVTTQNCQSLWKTFQLVLWNFRTANTLDFPFRWHFLLFHHYILYSGMSPGCWGFILRYLHVSLDVGHTVAHVGAGETWCLYRHASQFQWTAHQGLHPAPKTCSV